MMRIPQCLVLIVFISSFNRDHFTNIDDLFIPEDGESTYVFESFSDDLEDEQSFVVGIVLGARKKSTFLEQTSQRTIERYLCVETPPPENSCI